MKPEPKLDLTVPLAPSVTIRQGFGMIIRGEYQCFVVNGKTKQVVKTFPKGKNLILNHAMEDGSISGTGTGIPNVLLANLFRYAVASTGVTPTADDSGASVAAQVGTTVTISGGSFTLNVGTGAGTDSIDVGKVIKFDGGQEARITAVPAAGAGLTATVTPSQTVAEDAFTVYRTNQVQMSNTGNEERAGAGITGTAYLTGSGNCETVVSGSTVTMTRTYDFKLRTDGLRGAASTPYNELGWSELTTVGGSNLNSRVLLSVAVPVENGEQLRVKYSLIVTLSPTTPETVSSSPVTGWASGTGIQQIQLPTLAKVDQTTGATVEYYGAGTTSPLDPSKIAGGANGVAVSLFPTGGTNANAPNSFNTNGPARSTGYTTGATAPNTSSGATLALSTPKPTYAAVTSANQLFMDKIASYPSTAGNGTWKGVAITFNGDATGGLGAANQSFVYLFDTAQTKLSTFSLSLVFRFSWARALA